MLYLQRVRIENDQRFQKLCNNLLQCFLSGGYCHNLIGNILEDSLCIVLYVKGKMQGLSVYMPE